MYFPKFSNIKFLFPTNKEFYFPTCFQRSLSTPAHIPFTTHSSLSHPKPSSHPPSTQPHRQNGHTRSARFARNP